MIGTGTSKSNDNLHILETTHGIVDNKGFFSIVPNNLKDSS